MRASTLFALSFPFIHIIEQYYAATGPASYMCTTNLPLQQSERSAALHSLAAPTSATAAKSGGAGGRPGQQSTRSLLTVFSPTSRQQLLRSSSDNVLRSKLLESLNNSAAFAASVLVEDARE